MGATETATIVFTDVVGSTEMRAGLGEAGADAVRREHDHAVAQAIASAGGRIVKGTGDGVMAVFGAASDGIVASVAVQRATQRVARRRGVDLRVRVGVSAGDVSWDGGDCYGLPVVEAARLEAMAEPGQILCSDIVRVLARGRAAVEFAPAGERLLKGLPDPVTVYAVDWGVADDEVRARAVCIGRDADFNVLQSAWDGAGRGLGGVVLVAGEPGIGKTCLLGEFSERVRASNGAVLWGACTEGVSRAYEPVREMVEGWMRTTPRSWVEERLGPMAGLLARVVPAIAVETWGEAPGRFAEPEERERTLDALVEFVVAVGEQSPVLVVVDDAHWAEAATVDWLRLIARRVPAMPVLVVVAYRETDLDRRHPLAALLPAMRREQHVRRIKLSGLDAMGAAELVRDVAGGDVPPAVVEALHHESAGNPFFIRETVFHLMAQAGVSGPSDWSNDVLTTGIPEGVRELVGRRVSQLSSPANALLSVAAGIGSDFDVLDAAAVVGLDEDTALDAADEAARHQIIRAMGQVDRYEFTHALFRHTLWAEWSPSRRVRLHRAIAERLAERHGVTARPEQALAIASHYHDSMVLPGAEQGVAYALLVADRAAAQFAAVEEHAALEMALDMMPADERSRSAVLRERAAAAAIIAGLASAIDDARAAIDAHAGKSGPAAACRAAVRLGRIADRIELYSGCDYGALARPYEAALEPTSVDAIHLLGWRVIEDEYLDPDNPGIAVQSAARARMQELASRLPGRERPFAYGPSSARDALEQYRDDNNAVTLLACSGPGLYGEATKRVRLVVDDALHTGRIGLAIWMLSFAARLHLIQGDLGLASEQEAQALELMSRVDAGSNVAVQLGAFGMMRACLVDLEYAKAQADVERALEGASRRDLHWMSGGLRMFAAWMLVAGGDTNDGLDRLRRLMPVVERGVAEAPNYPMIVHFATKALWHADSDEHVLRIEPHLHRKVIAPDMHYLEMDARWDAALLCGLTGRHAEARTWFELARKKLTAQGARLLLPHVCLDEATMETRLGAAADRLNGRRRVAEALRMIDTVGLPALEPLARKRASELAAL